jgi:hypothetical protein
VRRAGNPTQTLYVYTPKNARTARGIVSKSTSGDPSRSNNGTAGSLSIILSCDYTIVQWGADRQFRYGVNPTDYSGAHMSQGKWRHLLSPALEGVTELTGRQLHHACRGLVPDRRSQNLALQCILLSESISSCWRVGLSRSAASCTTTLRMAHEQLVLRSGKGANGSMLVAAVAR